MSEITPADRFITYGENAMIQEHYLLQFFTFAHLPPDLQDISMPFAMLAQALVDKLPSNPEQTEALRKLLQAKDCAVRAWIFKQPGPITI